MSGGIFPAVIFPAGAFPRTIFQKAATLIEPEICYPLTVTLREPITSIILGQGDSRNIDIILKGAGEGVDLTNAIIKFIMKNDLNDIRHETLCKKGSKYKGSIIGAANGGATIPLTSTVTADDGTYYSAIVVTYGNKSKTFPSDDGYILVQIKKSL